MLVLIRGFLLYFFFAGFYSMLFSSVWLLWILKDIHSLWLLVQLLTTGHIMIKTDRPNWRKTGELYARFNAVRLENST